MKNGLSSIIECYNNLYVSRTAKAAARIVDASAEKDVAGAVKKYMTSKLPTVFLCGEKLPNLSAIERKKSFSAALVSSGDFLSGKKNSFPLLQSKKLRSFSIIGVQKYLFNPDIDILLNSSGFETLHIGEIRDDITQCEPLLRDAEFIFIDMRSIKYADYPYSEDANPNGLMSQEICQIARYAAFSQKLKEIFIFGIPESKRKKVCESLAAHVMWHITDGIDCNIEEDPAPSYAKGKLSLQFMEKIVDMGTGNDAISFVNSLNSGRWWMSIPLDSLKKDLLVPCSYKDYTTAKEGKLPIRWLFYYKRYNTF